MKEGIKKMLLKRNHSGIILVGQSLFSGMSLTLDDRSVISYVRLSMHYEGKAEAESDLDRFFRSAWSNLLPNKTEGTKATI